MTVAPSTARGLVRWRLCAVEAIADMMFSRLDAMVL